MHAFLEGRGFGAVALSGELSQQERTRALQSLRDGRARVCVATDVAARGLDLPDLGLVIHADLPTNPETLLHRSGRTGRAGRKGVSVLLVPASKRRRAEQLLQAANLKAVWCAPPGAAEIRVADQARFLDDEMLTEPPTDAERADAATLLAARAAEAVAVALMRLYRARLPTPMEVSPDHGDHAAPRAERATKPERPRMDAPVWFRLSQGRRENADPKWVLPLICRIGGVTRNDVGAIRIFDRETKFEVAGTVAQRFADAVRDSPSTDEARIEPSTPPRPAPARDGGPPVKRYGKRAA